MLLAPVSPTGENCSMRAMVLDAPGTRLRLEERPIPEPGPGQVLIRVLACAVCRTDLHVVDGELPRPKLPLVPGHEIIGTVVKGADRRFADGARVGVPWLAWTCGQCRFCTSGPDQYGDLEAAPLMCAGLIGYRCLKLAGDATRLGLYGFGAAAQQVIQVARSQGCRVFAFTRRGDRAGQDFARELGAEWAGASDERAPTPLDAAIIFAPVGSLVPAALASVDKGGVVVCGGIHMSDVPSFPYRLLWGERVVRSVANLTRQDGQEFLALAPRVPIRTHIERYPLAEANEALAALREGRLRGAAVLSVGSETSGSELR
jgi:propanol-preferring alcohol dehydrogenase